jgi:hypothetical protein
MNFSEEQSLVPHDNPAQEPILIHGPRVGEAVRFFYIFFCCSCTKANFVVGIVNTVLINV